MIAQFAQLEAMAMADIEEAIKDLEKIGPAFQHALADLIRACKAGEKFPPPANAPEHIRLQATLARLPNLISALKYSDAARTAAIDWMPAQFEQYIPDAIEQLGSACATLTAIRKLRHGIRNMQRLNGEPLQ